MIFLAENSRTFTSIFDLVDRFTAPYDAIQKKMNAITGKVHQVDIEFNESKAGQALDNIQKKVNDTTSTTNSWNNALGRAAGVADKTANSTKNIGNETQKTTGLLGSMQSKLENVGGVADKLRDKFGAITGLLAGGSIGGMSWLKAMSSDKSAASFERRMARKGIDTKPIDEFIAKAEGTGYTTTGTRRDIADTLLTRTNLRGAKMESTTKSIEDLYFLNSYDLNKNGITSAQDFSDLLTKKTLGPGDRQALIDIGFMNKNAKTMSVSNRLKAAQKQGAGIDETTLAAQDSYQAFLNRLSETSGKVGKTMVEPMNMVLGKVNSLLDLINNIPGAPGLIALIAVLMAAAGGASLLLTVLEPLGGVLKGLKLAETVKDMKGMSGITKLFSGGGSLSALMNPYVALAALAAIILVVAYKTGVLQKAWDKFTQSAIGKDIMSGLQGLADFVGGLMDQLSKWYEASGKNQMLEVFFTLAEVLGTAWDYIDRIYSTMRSGGANPILAGIAAISAAPMALGMGIGKAVTGKGINAFLANPEHILGMGVAKTIAGKDPAELLGFLLEQDRNILRWIATYFPLFGRILEILKGVKNLFEWLYSLFQSFWSWIQRAMPGAEKETARQKMVKQADQEHLFRGEDIGRGSGKWYRLDEYNQYREATPSKKLADYEKTYNETPGFAEGIAEAVKKGIAGIGTEIANAIKGIFPDFTPLTEALKSLQAVIDRFLGRGSHEGETPAFETSKGKAYNRAGGGYDVILAEDVPGLGPKGYEAQGLSEERARAAIGYASGATFAKSGMFRGKVHSPEEIIPQAIASKGAGPISRALSVLDSVMSGQPSSVAGASSVGDIHIHNSNDFSSMKVSGNVDIQKLMAQIDKRIDSRSVEAVKKAIGQRRT